MSHGDRSSQLRSSAASTARVNNTVKAYKHMEAQYVEPVIKETHFIS